MIKINYDYSKTKMKDILKHNEKIKEIVKNFNEGNCQGSDYIGWYKFPNSIDKNIIENIKKDAEEIKKMADVLVVCGIGGSYLGSRAVIEAVKGFYNKNMEVIYLGNTFDERYTEDTLNYLKEKNFCVNVISKSGTTLETAIAFRLLKRLLQDKYGDDYRKRIYVTTDEKDGCLREMADIEQYKSYIIPKDIGGRYSVFTPVGLLPICVAGIDIDNFLNGAKEAYKDVKNENFEENIAQQYASYRYEQYMNNENIEIFVTYSPYFNMLAEWWKQLFGESEGKDGKALFPASANFSTDLHSLGQYIQQGKKDFFITQIKVTNEKEKVFIEKDKQDIDNLNYLSELSLGQINLSAQEGANKAHYQIGKVDNFTFEIDLINEFNIGYILFTFMYSCMISANLLEVNPFNQQGVEFYKKEMRKILVK